MSAGEELQGQTAELLAKGSDDANRETEPVDAECRAEPERAGSDEVEEEKTVSKEEVEGVRASPTEEDRGDPEAERKSSPAEQHDADGAETSGPERELSAKLSSLTDMAQLLETQNAEKELLRRERQTLNEEVYRLTQCLFEKQGAIESLEQKMRDAFEQHSSAERALRTSNEQLSENCAGVEKLRAELEAELAAAREELSGAAEVRGALERALEDRNSCHKMLEDLRQALGAKEEAVTAMSKDISEKEAHVAELERRVVDLERSEAALKAREDELATLRSALRSKEEETLEKSATIGQLRDDVAGKGSQIFSLEEEVGQLKEAVRDALSRGNRLAEAEARASELERDLAATTSQLQRRTAENEELEQRLAGALAEAGVAQELKKSLCEKNDQVDSLTKEVAALQEAIQQRDDADRTPRSAEGEREAFQRAWEPLAEVPTVRESGAVAGGSPPRFRGAGEPEASLVETTAELPTASGVTAATGEGLPGVDESSTSPKVDEASLMFRLEWTRELDEIVAELREKHGSAARRMEACEEELRRLSARRGELLECEERGTAEIVDLESRMAEAEAERDRLARRRRNVSKLAETVVDVLQRKADALCGLGGTEGVSFANFTRVDDSLEWSYCQEQVMQERLFASNGGWEAAGDDWLGLRIEEICHLISSLGRTVRDLLYPEPPAFLSSCYDPRHLSKYLSNLEREYQQLLGHVGALQKGGSGTASGTGDSAERLDVRSEVRVDGRGNVETTASVRFSLAPDDSSSLDGTHGSLVSAILEEKEEAEKRCEELQRRVSELTSERQEAVRCFEGLVAAVASFRPDSEPREERERDVAAATREECDRALSKLESACELFASEYGAVRKALAWAGGDDVDPAASMRIAAADIRSVSAFLEVVCSERAGLLEDVERLRLDLRDAAEKREALEETLSLRASEAAVRAEEAEAWRKRATSLQATVDVLNRTLEEVEEILQKTTNDRDRYEEEVSSARDELQGARRAIAEEKELVSEKEAELDALKGATSELQQERDSLVERQRILESNLLELQTAAAEWEHRALSRKLSMEKLAQSLEHVAEKKDAALAEADDLRESCSQALAEKNRLEEEKRALLKQAEEQEQELLRADGVLEENRALRGELERVSERARRVDELSARVFALEEEKASLEARLRWLENLEGDLCRTRERLAEAEERLCAYEDKLEQLASEEAQLEEALNRNLANEARLRDAEAELAESRRRVLDFETTKKKLESAEREMRVANRNVEALRECNESLSREAESRNQQVECLQATVEELRGTTQKLSDEVLASAAELVELKGECERLSLAEAERSREKLHWEEVAERLSAEKREGERRLGESEHAAAELSRKNGQLAAELKDALSELGRLSSHAVRTNRELTCKEDELERLRKELKAKDESLADEARRSSSLEGDLAATTRELEQLRQTYGRDGTLASELEEAVALAERLREKLAAAEEETARFEAERDKESGKVERLRKELLESEARAEELEKELSTVKSRTEDFRLRVTAAMTAARKQERERLALEARLQSLGELLTRNEEAAARLQRLERRVQELEEEGERLREEAERHRADALEAWTRLGGAGKELRQSRDSNTWLRMRMRQYKERLAQQEKRGADASRRGACRSGSVERGNVAETTSPSSPLVTRTSIKARSPSKTRFCVTVSAVHTTPGSATKAGAAGGTRDAAGVKKSLFADVARRAPSPNSPKPARGGAFRTAAAETPRGPARTRGRAERSAREPTAPPEADAGAGSSSSTTEAASSRRAPPPRVGRREDTAPVSGTVPRVPTRGATAPRALMRGSTRGRAASPSRGRARQEPTEDTAKLVEKNCKVQ